MPRGKKESWSVFSTPVSCAGLSAQESWEQSTVVFMWPEWEYGTYAGQKAFEAFCHVESLCKLSVKSVAGSLWSSAAALEQAFVGRRERRLSD